MDLQRFEKCRKDQRIKEKSFKRGEIHLMSTIV